MIAVTIISPSYRAVGREAVKRMKLHTGLDVKIIRCKDNEGFEFKLNLDKLVGRKPCLFFDADLWCLRDWNPEAMLSQNIVGVQDSGVFNPMCFCHTDCMNHDLDWRTYLNTGLLILDFRLQSHRDVFKYARRSWKWHKSGKRVLSDNTDQSHISVAVKKVGVGVTTIPTTYNTYLYGIRHGQFSYIPRDIINIHAAGVPTQKKLESLKHESYVFGQEIYPMHSGAVMWANAKQFQLS